MVPQPAPAAHPLGEQIRTQALCVQFLEAARDAHARAAAEIASITADDEQQLARTVRLVQSHGFSFRAAADVLGVERTRLRRILRDHEDAGPEALGA
jgi:hypothetical protein